MGDITDTFSFLFLLPYPLVSRNRCYIERPTHTKNKHCNQGLFATDIGTYLSICPAILQKQGTISQEPHSLYRIRHLISAVLIDGMHICSFHFPAPLPYFAVTP